jgi:hypothetical protein
LPFSFLLNEFFLDVLGCGLRLSGFGENFACPGRQQKRCPEMKRL